MGDQDVSLDLATQLRALGGSGLDNHKSAHGYFSHHSGKVPLGSVTDFYTKAVTLADKAATEIERLQAEIRRLSGPST